MNRSDRTVLIKSSISLYLCMAMMWIPNVCCCLAKNETTEWYNKLDSNFHPSEIFGDSLSSDLFQLIVTLCRIGSRELSVFVLLRKFIECVKTGFSFKNLIQFPPQKKNTLKRDVGISADNSPRNSLITSTITIIIKFDIN
jgi:hypothetical protein